MMYAVKGSPAQLAALQQGSEVVQWQAVGGWDDLNNAAAFFWLADDQPDYVALAALKIPVFVHTTVVPLPISAGASIVGINGWPYFLERSQWEMAGTGSPAVETVLATLGKTAITAPNTPGLIAPRVVAMVVNEAYFALEDGVSSREDMDTAMRLGTNYPLGPFEWANRLGKKEISTLLQILAQNDTRCQPAPLLIQEATI